MFVPHQRQAGPDTACLTPEVLADARTRADLYGDLDQRTTFLPPEPLPELPPEPPLPVLGPEPHQDAPEPTPEDIPTVPVFARWMTHEPTTVYARPRKLPPPSWVLSLAVPCPFCGVRHRHSGGRGRTPELGVRESNCGAYRGTLATPGAYCLVLERDREPAVWPKYPPRWPWRFSRPEHPHAA